MSSSPRLSSFLSASAIALGCLVLLVATSPRLPIVWDEGDTILRAEALSPPSAPAADDDQPPRSDRSRNATNWPYTTQREGHPPLAGILIAWGSPFAPSWLDALTQARFGPMVLFSIAVGAMFYRLQRDYGVWAVSLMAVGALVTMPRLFAHAHFATLDGPLTACWLLAWATFGPATRDARWIPLFGLALGMTFLAKFTGWLAPLPFLAWTILYRDRGGVRALAAGVPIALAVFVACNPPLWEGPIEGLRSYFALNLDRAAQPKLNISTQFFGRLYNLDHPLPWYNTLVWTAITISPMALVIGCVGIVSTLRRWRTDRTSMLLVCQWATLVIVRGLPFSPPHDAERLILPSFAFFAALVGVGIGRGLYRETLLLGEKIVAQGWAKVALVIVLAAATFDSISYFPHGLSYYNRLVGGLRGASALGMEPTYYWDALDRETLAWLNEHTADDRSIVFAAYPRQNLELLQRWGLLRRSRAATASPRWYVLQRRPSALQPADQWLIENCQSAFERNLWGVRLLDVYDFGDYEKALDATR